MPQDNQVPLQHRKHLKVVVLKAAPVTSRTFNPRLTKPPSATAKSTKKQPTATAVHRPDPPSVLVAVPAAPVAVTSQPMALLAPDTPLSLDHHFQPTSSLEPVSSVDTPPDQKIEIWTGLGTEF